MKSKFKEILEGTEKIIHFKNNVVENPLLTVIILAYNHENYISKCIENALNQEVKFNFEIIIGEDFSSDKTRDICKSYAERNPHKIRLILNDQSNVIYHDNSRTGRYNLLYCISQARGKYIALCDGDDYWTDNCKIQKQVEFLENNKNYCMCFTDICVIDNHDNILKERLYNHKKSTFDALDLFQKTNPVNTLTSVFKNKDFTNNILKNVCKSHWADWMIWSIIAVDTRKKIYFFDEVCGAYRQNPNGMSSRHTNAVSRNKNILFHKQNLQIFGNRYTKTIKNTISLLTFEKFNQVQKQSKFRGLVYLFLNLKWMIYQNSIRDVIYVLRSK